MATILPQKSFFRIKAAMHDLIDRAGGIERAAEICGYSKSAVGRWHSRTDQDMMPLAAVVALEADTGSPLVTRSMCNLAGLETAPAPATDKHLVGAYVQLTASTADLNSTVAEAMADGVITPCEQVRIDQKAAALNDHNEALRGSIAAAGGKPLRLAQ